MTETLPKDLPEGRIDDAANWKAADLAVDEASWIHRLDGEALAEIDDAIQTVMARRLDTFEFGHEDFPLPTLGPRLRRIGHELDKGRGLALIRGLDLTGWDLETAKLVYWGLAVHLGTPISQNAKGQLIAHVADTGRDYMSKNVRGYTTAARLRPHCDPTDVVGLLCWHPAKSGGESLVASGVAIFDEIRRTNPEYVAPLMRGFHFDLRGEGATDDPDETTFNRVPVFSWYAGRLSCRFNQKTIEDGQKKRGEPLSELEQAAVARVGELAMDDRFRYDMSFERGDIQLLCNHSILHSRNAFEDHEDPSKRRNLFRLWLNLREARELAPEFADRLNTGPRGGVMVREAAE